MFIFNYKDYLDELNYAHFIVNNVFKNIYFALFVTLVGILLSHLQILLLEKLIQKVQILVFVDKRKYATSFYVANGSRVVLMHEKLLKRKTVKVNKDVRKWNSDKLTEYLTVTS